MNRLINRLPIPFAVFPFLVVLAGYLFPENPALVGFRNSLIKWAVIIAAFSFLLGILNILRVHSTQVVRRQESWYYSIVLLLVMVIAMIPLILDMVGRIMQQILHLDSQIPTKALDNVTSFIFDHIIRPSGASLAALVVFTLTLAAFRLLRVRRSPTTVLFLIIVALVLLGTTPLVGLGQLSSIRDWIVNVPGMAGMRGLLLGVALGTVITALRIFLTIDRPYSES